MEVVQPQQAIYHWKGNLMASMIHFTDIGKYFDFETLGAIFAKLLHSGSKMAVRKNVKLLKSEHIVYSLEARDLEISNI